MAKVTIKDDAIWLKHIEGDPRLKQRLLNLAADGIIDLEIDDIVGRWQRMKVGKDGRPTPGIKPIEAMRDVWARMRQQPGRVGLWPRAVLPSCSLRIPSTPKTVRLCWR